MDPIIENNYLLISSAIRIAPDYCPLLRRDLLAAAMLKRLSTMASMKKLSAIVDDDVPIDDG